MNNKQSTHTSPGFEETLEQLTHAVQKLDSGDLSLEQALKAFEQGVKLGSQCQNMLQKAEQQVTMLMEETSSLKPFNSETITQAHSDE